MGPMQRRRLAVLLLVVSTTVSLTTTPVLAQKGTGAGVQEAGVSGITAIFVFIAGAALLVYSVEKLIGYLTRAAAGLNVSLFLLAVIFTGVEFDDIALGLVLGLENFGGVALGIVFGTALSLTGVTLALAAILTPTSFDVPRNYVTLFAVSPFVLLPFIAIGGAITRLDGVILIALFLAFLGYIVYHEFGRESPVFRSTEVREVVDGGTEWSAADDIPFAPDDRDVSAVVWLGASALALVGLVIGSATMATGTEGIIASYGIEGTIFGATIATAVLTIEDVFLTVEPIRRGAPEIGIGNVIGSVIFSVTAKLGVIALAGSIVIGPLALRWHLLVVVIVTLLAAYLFYTGQLKPWYGYTLLCIYVAYWVISYALFGFVPVE